MPKKTLIRIIPAPEGQPAMIIHGKMKYSQHLRPETRQAIRDAATAWFWAELIDGIWWIDARASKGDLDALRRSMMRRAKTMATSRYPAAGGMERRKAPPKPVSVQRFSWDD